MKTIETEIEISEGGQVTLPVPEGIAPGKHAVVVVIEGWPGEAAGHGMVEDFPVDSVGPWPTALSLRREDLYGDAGR